MFSNAWIASMEIKKDVGNTIESIVLHAFAPKYWRQTRWIMNNDVVGDSAGFMLQQWHSWRVTLVEPDIKPLNLCGFF